MSGYVDILDDLDRLNDEIQCIKLIMQQGTYKDYVRNHYEVLYENTENRIEKIKKDVREFGDEVRGYGTITIGSGIGFTSSDVCGVGDDSPHDGVPCGCNNDNR